MTLRSKITLKTSQLLYNKKLIVSIIIIFVSIWSFPFLITELINVPDNWWVIGLHLIKTKDLVWGTDIVWTYGPLGYLLFPINVDNELWKHTFFYGIISHSLFFLTAFFFVLKTNHPIRNAIVFGFFSIFFMWIDFYYFHWIGILLGFYLYLEYVKNKFLLIPLAFSVAFLTFTKFDLGIGSTSILVLSCIYLALRGRIKESIFCIVLYALFLILIWQVVTNSLESFPSFITNSLDLANGFTSVMPIDNLPFFILLMSIPTLVLYIFWVFNKNQNNRKHLKFLFISPITIFFFFKEGYMRFDLPHVMIFFLLAATFFLILTMIKNGKTNKILLYSTYGMIIVYSFTSLFLFSELLVYTTIQDPTVSETLIEATKTLGFAYSASNLPYVPLQLEYLVNDEQLELNKAEQKQNLKNSFSPLSQSTRELSQSTLKLLGNHTVDVIPFDIALVHANDLNYQPRPLMATVGYTQITDRMNAKHFTSASSPDYILYEKKTLDYHYPLFDEPATFRTLLCYYNPVHRDGERIVLEKNDKNICLGEEIISAETVHFEELVSVPISTEGYLFAKISIQQNLFGKIFDFLYKQPQVFIQINEENVFRFITSTAQNGILLNYDLEYTDDCFLIDRVNSFLITTEYHDLYGIKFHTLDTGPINLIDPQSLFEEEIKIEFLEMKINKTSPQEDIIC